eukprot:TRINITY_DN10504_c0_g1_i1.p1 TRINITY_DN10504_c0_g1~~TRINITY_DN10504_c0_g1_i1.p1  ORF type:complete len:286 (+),score=85.09 TRINITY_DN10504_c0_g1_i1:124-981(+)
MCIRDRKYATNDVLMLQEVSSDFIRQLGHSSLATTNHIVLPAKLDSKRDQNSVILLSKLRFGTSVEHVKEVTPAVEKTLKAGLAAGKKSPLANGDLLAIQTEDVNGQKYTFASFHGDTNGLASVPVLSALHEAVNHETNGGRQLVFALDANTYENPGTKGEKQGVLGFTKTFLDLGMSSCWGNSPNPQSYTTCNARTFLQPQLNKACHTPQPDADGLIRKFPSKADVNLKDYILFYSDQLTHSRTLKDNTGKRTYQDGIFFPTMTFPSDHGLVETVLMPKQDSSL